VKYVAITLREPYTGTRFRKIQQNDASGDDPKESIQGNTMMHEDENLGGSSDGGPEGGDFSGGGGFSGDEGAGVGFATMRGRDYPSIRQFTVFLENRVGQLLEVVRRFEGSNVRIVALTISDSTECAVVRFLLNDPEAGREVLERAGLAIVESDLIGVELPDSPQPLLQVCTALLQAEINISQVYPLLSRPHGNPAVALMVDNIEMALDTLTNKGFSPLNEDDLKDYE